MQVTHFTLTEFVRSRVALHNGIDNTPPSDVLPNLMFTMECMERVRGILMRPILIHSGYRCLELNKAVGGSKNSQHMTGEACDFSSPSFGTNREIVTKLVDHVEELGIDQMILEYSWVHVSFSRNPRHSVLYFG